MTTNWKSSTQQKGQQLIQNQFITSYEDIKTEDILEDIEYKQNDPRIRRLMSRKDVKREDKSDEEEDRRHSRRVLQPQIISIGAEDKESAEDVRHRRRHRREAEDESSDGEDDEENIEKRHQILRLKKDEEEEELLAKVEDEEEEEEEVSEYEDYTDSEDETGPRLKPVFVRKRERITLTDAEKEEIQLKQQKEADRRAAEERRRTTLKIIEDDIRREDIEKEDQKEEEAIKRGIATVLTDDETEETAYEYWKLRELKRIKRDKEESEAYVRERQEVERLRLMTEEERQQELKINPKIVTNAAPKGKYKFLQKYFHRGAFYLDHEDEVFKRDFAQPTLEDHFDRTTVPKVMQVKNFGRSGRTKYTHLVDQDTTAFDSAWAAESTQSEKFTKSQAGGMKQVFERPSGKRK